MPLINVNVNIPERCAIALERIAVCLERAVPPIPESRLGFHKRDASSVISYGNDEQLYKQEVYGDAVRERGLSPEEETRELDQWLAMDDEEEPDYLNALPPELS